MPHLELRLFRNTLLAASLAATANLAWGFQQPAANTADSAVIKQGPSPKASAYYHYSLGHMYEEMAEALGNKADYLNKAIDNYRLAMQEDPSASFLVEDIAELYRASGRIREAVLEAEQAIKTNPNDLNARRVLARIYTQQIGDSQANRIDEGMVKKAIEQYKFIADKDPKDIDSLVMLGRLYKVSQDSNASEAAFKKALDADPDNEDALTGLAMVYSDLGDSKRATALLEKLSAKNPSPRALMALAASYEQVHEYGLAAGAYRRALALDPSRVEIKQALAQDLAISEQFDEALKLYQELATENPRDSQASLRMSQIYRQQRKFDLARQALNKASELNPDDLEIKYNESLLQEDEGKLSEAIVTLKQIIDTTAKKSYSKAERDYRAGMLERLGTLYRNLEQFDQAADAFRQIESLDPDVASRAEAQIIDTYRMGKDFTKAQQLSDAAAKKYPNDRTLLAVRASLLADLGKGDEAAAELKKTLGGKNDRETYLTLAQVYDKSHNYVEMAKALDAAEKLSESKDDKVTIYFMRGAMFERQKKFDLAEKQFREVLVLDSQNASALNYLGYMFADQGVRLPEAQELIEKAVAVEPNNGAFLDSLGWVYYRQNKLKEAEEQLNRSLQMISKDPTIHDHLGDVYFKQGKLKEAIAQWQASLAEWNSSAPSDREPEDVAKVQKKLDGARVRLAKEQGPAVRTNNN
jgi:tetratricopeptide (TPR) repeat protein